ncbi:MAG TPA: cell division protein FtsA [Spirochaetota bacterium]|nr:cell division protein FtsA [Spirochaetota bacterium]HOM39029.1 cell division protein FtsA [Spirochaetota bacterium]HPQ49918.1 cell division protein FtsA [Spirochaetota bacterium]
MGEDNIIVGIDIGSSKTSVAIVQRDLNELLILGLGSAPNDGMNKGTIVNIDQTIKSIKQAAQEATLMAGLEFNQVNINLPGEVFFENSQGIAAISRKDREVREEDVNRAIEQAKSRDIGNRSIVHVFPQYYKLDDYSNIKNPIGMSGFRLECSIHIVTVPKINISNIVRTVTKAGFKPYQGFVNSYASSRAVLEEEDKEGAIVLDIGAGTIDIMGFKDGYPVLSSVVALGGSNLTKDLHKCLGTTFSTAEKIKIKYGSVVPDMVTDENIEVPSYAKHGIDKLNKKEIARILEPRAIEILEIVKKNIKDRGFDIEKFSFCVLTGGGAKTKGIAKLAQKIFGIPVRVGYPINVKGVVDEINDPAYSCVIGLCLGDEVTFTSDKKEDAILAEKDSVIRKIGNIIKDILG